MADQRVFPQSFLDVIVQGTFVWVFGMSALLSKRDSVLCIRVRQYSVKTSRPSYSQLSNNVSYMNRFTRQTGNPYLDNETNHRVELSGVWKFIQFMVNYKDSRNAIIYWAEQIPGNEAITMISRKNVKSLKSMTAYK